MKYHRINNERFSIRLCLVAKNYGFKTIGTMYKALKKANADTKWYFRPQYYVRGERLIREIEYYFSN
jgi:hypothetical protein